VTLVDPATRTGRPGGRWSSPRLTEQLLQLATVERAVAHVIAGWVAKVGELDDKLALAAELESSILRAVAVRQQALVLFERDEAAIQASPQWIEPLRALDACGDADRVVAAVLGDVRRFLIDRYRGLDSELDPLLDARLRSTVRHAIAGLEDDASGIGLVRQVRSDDSGLRSALEAAWDAAAPPSVPMDQVLWASIDRVPVPSRPAGRPRPLTGARSHIRVQSRRSDEDLSGELNDNIMAELSALELMCRCSYEHPELPWSSHVAMARHGVDEARHAALFRRLLFEHGFDETHMQQHAANYEWGYEFAQTEPGSPRELLWRVLVLGTILEALAVDKLPVEIGGRDWVAQYDLARTLDYIGTDELFHIENGQRLSKRICDEHGFDPILERELVHGAFFGKQYDVRFPYLDADPERAAAEIEALEAPDPDGVPYTSRTEVELRLRSAFSIEECEQVEQWGYNPIRHPLLDELADSAS
jgi:uncharacterized ferritin-like protein (DUF455 family)